VPLLVLANKHDKDGIGLKEMVEKLGLFNLRKEAWFVQSTCALTGEGL
jgi:ADP-ribosylation factor protein 1